MANLLTKLYYMVPMNNAPLIAILGLLSYNWVNNNPNFRSLTISIADPFVNSRRHRRTIKGLSLHDFVPLYWETHTPMQYVVTVKECKLVQEDLVFFILNAETVLGLPGVYTTDGNAASSGTNFYEGKGALPHLDWQVINTPNCYSSEYKRKKCAEVLVPERVEPNHIQSICVYSESARRILRQKISEIKGKLTVKRRTAPIKIAPHLYY